MFHDVLVPTDGSAGSEAVLAHATEIARTYGADVHALFVVDSGSIPGGLDPDQRDALSAPSERRGREATIRIANRLEEEELGAAREVRDGVPYREILDYADEQGVDLILMGTHGRTGVDRARLGSTTERVLGRADVPVLSIRLADDGAEPSPPSDGYDTVVVPTDGSDVAERAAETALELAETYGSDVHVVYVVDATVYDLEDAPRSVIGLLREGGQKATEEVAATARERDLSATTELRRGAPAAEVLAATSAADADLVAMGTRGRTLDSSRLLGSTTAQVVRRSPVPVLTVR
ncbi:universal stress protein [Natrarchaeobius oligotrophus]|uniref:Universal stress protein n=1 Tax=Natrarchaeobius chitinivorans TaxID=1679083 RepID=A0A3N6N469_NATCH|nr:universal stress protein [Natrarchaeobius chitinivorans]RQH02527.1 universal stress protein [Natrarchaeobius chitinivorans]